MSSSDKRKISEGKKTKAGGVPLSLEKAALVAGYSSPGLSEATAKPHRHHREQDRQRPAVQRPEE